MQSLGYKLTLYIYTFMPTYVCVYIYTYVCLYMYENTDLLIHLKVMHRYYNTHKPQFKFPVYV